jgi:hypothetical protein
MSLEHWAWISTAVAILCALLIAIDELRHPQRMAVMDAVWPVTSLYFSVFGLWAYFVLGRRGARDAPAHARPLVHTAPSLAEAAMGTSHCGAGCMLADVACAFLIAATGLRLFGSTLLAEYTADFAAAWALGIVFQYLAIRPMRPQWTAAQAIAAAIKADTLSILAFQVGMYAWMALVHFVFFANAHLNAFDPRYWLMMQAGMIAGFATSLPMNRWLIAKGWKEAM